MDTEAGVFGPSSAEDRDREIDELSRLADELVEQIGAARRHLSQLRSAADGFAPLAEPADESARGAPGRKPQSHPSAREEAELVALNMALTGGDRSEAQRQIADTFGLEDTAEILDTAFGHSEDAASPRRRRFGRLRRR